MSESAEFREAEAASSPQISQYVRGTCEVRRGNEAGLDLVLSSFHQSTGVEAEAIRNDAIGLAVILHSKTARAWMHDAGFDNVSDLDALASYFYQTGDRPAGDALVQELIRTDVGASKNTTCERTLNQIVAAPYSSESLKQLDTLKAGAAGYGLPCLERVLAVRCQTQLEAFALERSVPLWNASAGACESYFASVPSKRRDAALVALRLLWPSERGMSEMMWLNMAVIASSAVPDARAVESLLRCLENGVQERSASETRYADVYRRLMAKIPAASLVPISARVSRIKQAIGGQ